MQAAGAAGSTLLVGSSASSRLGRPTTARPTATSCRWPIDSSGGFLSMASPRPNQASRSATWRDTCSSSAPPTAGAAPHVERAQMIEQPEVLEYHADALAQDGALRTVKLRDLAPEQHEPAARRRLGQAQQPQQGGLAGAARAHRKWKLPAASRRSMSCSTSAGA